MKSQLWAIYLLLTIWGGIGFAASRPDERVLWQLFHAGKTGLLNQAIREYRQRYPGWTPPAALRRALASWHQGRSRDDRSSSVLKRIGIAIRRQNWAELTKLAKAYPALFTCSRPGHLQVLALAHARTGNPVEAGRHYRRLLACAKVDPCEVLSQALGVLPVVEFHRLLESAASSVPPELFAEFSYRSRLQALWEAYRREDHKRFEALANGLAEEALEHHDTDLVSMVGWYWHDQRQWAQAADWFRLGLRFDPDNSDLIRGLLSASIELQQDGQVILLVQEHGARYPDLQKGAAGYLLGRGWNLFRQGDFSNSREYAQLARLWSEDKDDAEYLLAWLDLEDGLYSTAQRRFETLYRQQPDNVDYAQALTASHLRAGEDPDRLAAMFPADPTLSGILAPHRSRKSYDRKQFLRAWHLYPQGHPRLKNIDSPDLGAAALYRYKSGNSGLDRLQTYITPLMEGGYAVGPQHFSLQLGYQVIQSGKLHDSGIHALQTSDQPLSVAQLQDLEDEAQRLRSNPPTRQVRATLLEFGYRFEGPYNPYVSMGLTPVGGPLSLRPTFRLGIGKWMEPAQTGWKLHWNAEGYSQPVRQSLLSYTGWKMLGERWGRVLKSGVELTGLLQRRGTGWNLYQSLDIAFLDGKRTKDNWMIGYTMAPGYDFGVQGFDYFTLGPYFNFLHYGNNQNHFRLGHGGYFSPQEFYAGGLQLGLRTLEGRKFMIEGRVGIGVQFFREGKEAWYPQGCGAEQVLCSVNPDYPENREISFAPSGRVRFVWQIHPHLQLAGGVYGQRTSGYDEFGGGLSLRWLFQPRPAVFSSDLPGYLFGILQ